MAKKSKNDMRQRRHRRVRMKISGTPERPRMNIFRSLNHIYVQLIDDQAGKTIVAVSTLDDDVKSQLEGLKRTEQAKVVGTTVAERAKEQGVKEVVFDRGGYKFHGRVRMLAEAAREAGLKF